MTDARARNRWGAGTGLHYLLCGLALLLGVLTASCGNTTFSPGTPIATIKAEPGRFTSYIVYIDQIYFTRQDGTTAILPAISQHVDLASLSSNIGIYTLSPVEVGTYTSATFELNYSGAYITADVNGQSTAVTPVDPSTSAAAGVASVTVKFDPNHPLVIKDHNSSPVAFDIDLEASNIIGTASDGTLQTTVKPFWTATTTPVYNKPIFARGLFVITDTKNNNFTMNVRPLRDVINSPFGALTVNVNDQTYYQINGSTYVGASGLAALSALQATYANLQVGAIGPVSSAPFGDLSTIKPSMSATAVYVGSSLESTIEDQVSGFVSGVSGNVVTVQGATFADHFGDLGFAQSLPVTLGPNTIISQDGVSGVTPTISSISVGQFITVLGQATATLFATGIYNPSALDATGSLVAGNQARLQNSTFYGTLNSLSGTNLSVTMTKIDNYEPTAVKFAGTGAGGNDASASNYIVNTGSLDTSALSTAAPGTLLKIEGMPTSFGSGPPYFNASAITLASQLDAQLILEWSGTGSSSPFTTVSGSNIVVNLADAALTSGHAQIRVGPVTTTDLLATPPASGNQLTLAFNTSNTQEPPLFGVGSVVAGASLYSDPSAFATQVQSVVNSTNPAIKLVATGQYDPTTGTFTATNVTINVK
jgi:hypothetical protein